MPLYIGGARSKHQLNLHHWCRICGYEESCEYICGLTYKLRMMGIPVEGPTCIYGDNQSVVANSTIPDSTLKKESQSIVFILFMKELLEMKWRTSYVNTHENEADLLPKHLPHGDIRKGFVSNLVHHNLA